MNVPRRWLWLGLPALAVCFAVGYATARALSSPKSLLPVIGMLPSISNPAVTDSTPTSVPVEDRTFDEKIKPFLGTHCNSCHNSEKQAGGVPLDVYLSEAHAKRDRKMWETIHRVMAAGEMPPKRKPQPPADDKKFVLNWIEERLLKIDCTAPKDPGRVTLRRLNRAEYNNTIRDLCGVDFHPADDFPSDDVGYGFDNIGDVLSMPPILLEKYLTAADSILNRAVSTGRTFQQAKETYRPQNIIVTPRSARIREMNGFIRIEFREAGNASIERYHFPADGQYAVRVRAWGETVGDQPPKFTLEVDGKTVKSFDVTAKKGRAGTHEATIQVQGGDRKVSVIFTNPFTDAQKNARTLGVESVEVEGPVGGGKSAVPESSRLILVATPNAATTADQAAEKVLSTFARKAYRRPPKPEEIQRLLKLFQMARAQGDPFETAIKLPLKAVLVSPYFLFRVEDDPKNPDTARVLNDHELATRLSYFLWSSMPDDELSQIADRGTLRQPGVLKTQVERMLRDPKSSALTQNFAGQWLQLRHLQTLAPDVSTFKTWDERLRRAMIRETELFFEYVVKNDRSVMEFLDADYTFVNERLSTHYGIPNVHGDEFRRVKLPDSRRGGIVTQASVLTVTSNPTRTSPVKRGKWILENILGTPPPPPAPDVPELPPTGQLKGTLRQQMEQHRENPSCANCHAKLDPLGFGLENFDGIGVWRDQDNRQKIDASGILPDGAKFDGPAEMRKVLLGKSDEFRRCLAEKLLTYSLGRGLEYYDKCALDEIVTKLKAGQDRFSALVVAVVETDAFQKRKGKRSE